MLHQCVLLQHGNTPLKLRIPSLLHSLHSNTNIFLLIHSPHANKLTTP
jgi:hypothetical protein